MYWLIAAVLLFVLEMLVGTSYLLVVSASLAAAGLADWLLGTSLLVNISIASAFSILSIFLVHRWQRRYRTQITPDADDLDIGQTVILEHPLPTGLWAVRYRGSQWQAQINTDIDTDTAANNSADTGQLARIIGKRDGVLQLVLLPHTQQHKT